MVAAENERLSAQSGQVRAVYAAEIRRRNSYVILRVLGDAEQPLNVNELALVIGVDERIPKQGTTVERDRAAINMNVLSSTLAWLVEEGLVEEGLVKRCYWDYSIAFEGFIWYLEAAQ